MVSEDEIKAAGAAVAPRITPADIEANIKACLYFSALDAVVAHHGGMVDPDRLRGVETPLSLLTFCVLVLQNGFTVTGESACASPENFNADIGRKVARGNAVSKVWSLMGYELKTKLSGN